MAPTATKRIALAACTIAAANEMRTPRRTVSPEASRYDVITALPWPGPTAWKTP